MVQQRIEQSKTRGAITDRMDTNGHHKRTKSQ